MSKIFSASDSSVRLISRQRGVGFRPRGIDHYVPTYDFLPVCKFDDPDTYGHLDDNTSYAEYAWEFLRRNLFYQRMVDKRNAPGLEAWGYRSLPLHEWHFGLSKQVHYRNRYASNFRWYPIEYARLQMAETVARSVSPGSSKGARPPLEHPGSSIEIVFDVSSIFGPECVNIDLQAALAVEAIATGLKTLASNDANRRIAAAKRALGTDVELPAEEQLEHQNAAKLLWLQKLHPLKQPNRASLRAFLRMADLLSTKREPVQESSRGPAEIQPKWLTIKEAGEHLRGSEPKDMLSRAERYASEAWAYVYNWKCLSLLTMDTPRHGAIRASRVGARLQEAELSKGIPKKE